MVGSQGQAFSQGRAPIDRLVKRLPAGSLSCLGALEVLVSVPQMVEDLFPKRHRRINLLLVVSNTIAYRSRSRRRRRLHVRSDLAVVIHVGKFEKLGKLQLRKIEKTAS